MVEEISVAIPDVVVVEMDDTGLCPPSEIGRDVATELVVLMLVMMVVLVGMVAIARSY